MTDFDKVQPFQTAIPRKDPSTVAKAVMRILPSIHPFRTILDFGCGHGVDVRYYQEQGFDTVGYDIHPPFGFANLPDRQFDLVTVVYVLNVLGTPADRLAALRLARQYIDPQGALLVAARPLAEIESNARARQWPAFGDGYWSNRSRGMFQHGMTAEELTALGRQVGLRPHEAGDRLRLPGCAYALFKEG